jgi:hypothetical protein
VVTDVIDEPFQHALSKLAVVVHHSTVVSRFYSSGRFYGSRLWRDGGYFTVCSYSGWFMVYGGWFAVTVDGLQLR